MPRGVNLCSRRDGTVVPAGPNVMAIVPPVAVVGILKQPLSGSTGAQEVCIHAGRRGVQRVRKAEEGTPCACGAIGWARAL